MVKRIKDLTQTVDQASNSNVNSDATAKDVQEISNVLKIQDIATEQEAKKKEALSLLQKPQVLVCQLCEQGVDPRDIKYYDIALLRKFLSVRGKIIPRSKSGLCAKHQRAVVRAIKRARQIALLPYIDTGM